MRPPPRQWSLYVDRLLRHALCSSPSQVPPELRDPSLISSLLLWQLADCFRHTVASRILRQAARDASRAVRKWRWCTTPVLTRAWVRLELGRLAPALADFDMALQLEPENAVALMGRARAHAQLAVRAESPFEVSAGFMFALADVEAFSLLCPDGSDSASERGMCFFQKGIAFFTSEPACAAADLEAAADNFEAALLAHAKDADRHLRLVEALAWRVLLEGGEAKGELVRRFTSAYQTALARGADDASMHTDVGFAFARAGCFREALTALRLARRLRPRDRSLKEMLAEIEAKQRSA